MTATLCLYNEGMRRLGRVWWWQGPDCFNGGQEEAFGEISLEIWSCSVSQYPIMQLLFFLFYLAQGAPKITLLIVTHQHVAHVLRCHSQIF